MKFCICSNMDGVGGYYAKWNVRQRNKNTVWSNLFVESKKIQQTSDYNTKKQTHMHREQTSGYQWGKGRELKGKNYYVQNECATRCIVQHKGYSQYFIITLSGV